MRLLKIFFVTLVAVLVASCKDDNYEVIDLSLTDVYNITNTSSDSTEPVVFTLFYELNSVLVWTSSVSVDPEYELVEILDYSYDYNRIMEFTVKRTTDGVTSYTNYAVEAYGEDATGATGTMRIVREGEAAVTIEVTVTDETRYTDRF
ncbi:MAG: hypothetical protein SNG35_04915 [Rikenellaceae bacterium]